MYNVYLRTLAKDINIIELDLIQYFLNIGISKNLNSFVTIEERKQLFKYLNKHNIKFNHTLVLYKQTEKKIHTERKYKKVQVEFKKIKNYNKFNINRKEICYKNNNIKNKELICNKNYQLNNHSNIVNKKLNDKNINSTSKITNNFKNHIVSKNKNYISEKLKEKNVISIINKKNKSLINKGLSLPLKNSQKLLNANRSSHRKSSYFLFNKPNNYKNNLKLNQKYQNKKLNNTYEINKNEQLENKFEKKTLKFSNRNNNDNFKNNFKNSLLQQSFQKPNQIINRDVIISNTITVTELANKMAIKVPILIKKMISLGITASIDQVLDKSTVKLIAITTGHKVIVRKENQLEESIIHDRNTSSNNILKIRPPVVTIMGHVNHGKTSLLDCIRSTKIASKECGGITQHIGAYHVKIKDNVITFLDTPGHAAFTSMRLRGAKITDIIILVVAIDDGVKPQTIEAIQHSKAANVPIIVAINKIDKLEEGNLNQIKNELSKYDLLSEEWGGENIFVNVSAKKNIGIKNLLDAILLQSEILELKVKANGMAKGIVIESYLNKGKGPIATVLVKEGILNQGDIVVCGIEYGKIRNMRDEDGNTIFTASPSIPVEIIGLSGIPIAGDYFTVVKNEKKAREVALYRQSKFREIKLSRKKRLNLENLFDNINKSDDTQLKLILKVDMQGSLEAISESLYKISTPQVKINIINVGVGSITETDASLAAASNAIILGFNVRADYSAKKVIESENVDLRYYSIIYNLLDDIKLAIDGLLIPKNQQEIIGLAEVRNIFKSPKFKVIAGCMVLEGIIKRNHPIHVLRKDIVVYKGELESLRRFKDDVDELRHGMECGIGVKNYNDIHIGDKIEVFKITNIKQKN
ncbi:translation initiation factor [Buchnera aphidicola (Nipponaphis monzeni)]|uniref:Translation initiation factor IF-2 n=1 Tax=Buchnera aphidicola (Nipponaphis monzeni) TaxID=2495405 RepID=A0A455TAB7_9GAMM|nr:translation initiation factor IF-2 [Buchnera aphidicola]BBI01297.1 translation initiation factor [Buchnera aphidicola (Nipponaphis monzeni)]